ncbi:MAG: S46 family peptidase [Bacteroidales bacterium]
MKKQLLSILLLIAILPIKVFADEGMWLPILIGKNIDQMQKMGLKLSAEDIYSVNHASLKDAVVQFGGGCTAELISSEGLIITNHHCGFSSIQSHSSVNNNYLSQGFWAMSKLEELPNPGLTVRFLVRMEDVTSQVLNGVTPEMSEVDRQKIVSGNIKELSTRAEAEGVGYKPVIRPMYYGNVYYLFLYEEFSDVRLVGAPPESIGKFGGDTDNWVWPRHTGDFSLFRIYAGKDNKPAEYSPDNIPYTPRRFLPISMKGFSEGDFTFIYGFPGRTQQFITSHAVELLINQSNPHKINLRSIRLSIFNNYMESNDTIRIQYASKDAGVANAWKKWIGETIGLRRLDAVAQKQEQENLYMAWANSTPELKKKYGNLLPTFKRLYGELTPLSLITDYRTEDVYAVELINYASRFDRLIAESVKRGRDTAKFEDLKRKLLVYSSSFYKNFNVHVDMDVFAAMMKTYYDQIPKNFQPDFLGRANEGYNGNWIQMASDLYNQSVFADSVRVLTLLSDIDSVNARLFQSDNIYGIYSQFERLYTEKVQPRYMEITDSLDILYRQYVEGLMKMQDDKMFFPDANSTLRVAYGKIAGFDPKDGVSYNCYTTIDGIAEKSTQVDVSDYRPPQKLLDMIKSRDYGQYAVNGTVPVAFIATNHTTGGNSGSPVLDANGYLIGVNFDRCWESTMSDVMFDPDYCRNIALDVRYALFIIDKFAGASHLLNEMRIIR